MRPGFSFLVCPDSALLREEMERQISAFLPAGESWKRLVFWGDEEPGDNFWDSLGQAGLFAEKRLIIVRQAENWPASVWKGLSSALAKQLEHIWPVFCLEVAWEAGKFKIPAHIQKSRCFTFADGKHWVWRSQGLGQNLRKFVAGQAKALGLLLDEQELGIFCESAPPDATGIVNELRKLALLAENGKVSLDALRRDCPVQESDSFGLIRKLLAGDLTGAWQEASLDADGSLLFFAIAVLAREFRTLWQINSGAEPRLYPAEASRKKSLARKLGMAGISSGLAALADAEWQVKSGRQSPAQALETLCVTMCRLFG